MQVCEKEMKVKAFSKEGLQAPQKDNPQERAKTEMRDKVNQHVEHLETQVWPLLHYMHVHWNKHMRLRIHYLSTTAHSSLLLCRPVGEGGCHHDKKTMHMMCTCTCFAMPQHVVSLTVLNPTVCKVGSCNEQVEEFDSEIESLQSNVKRKQKPPPRLAHLEESVNRHKTHIGRLEQIIRLLDNDALHPDELSQVVNEEIQEYIDRNQEDFDAYEVGHMQLSNWFVCCILLLVSCDMQFLW